MKSEIVRYLELIWFYTKLVQDFFEKYQCLQEVGDMGVMKESQIST